MQITKTGLISMQVAGALTSALGSFLSARAERDALKAQARSAQLQSQSLQELGAFVDYAAQFAKSERMRQAEAMKSRQRVAYAASGIAVDSASAAEVQASEDLFATIDKMTIDYNAAMERQQLRQQANRFATEAGFLRAARAGISPGARTLSSLVGGATEVASTWYRLKHGASGG